MPMIGWPNCSVVIPFALQRAREPAINGPTVDLLLFNIICLSLVGCELSGIVYLYITCYTSVINLVLFNGVVNQMKFEPCSGLPKKTLIYKAIFSFLLN